MDIKKTAEKLKQDIPAIFMALSHRRTTFYAKIFACITIVYALSPIDFIPDFIPVLGLLDDIIILPLLAAVTIKLIPPFVFDECRQKSQSLWQSGKPKKWYYALPFLLIWCILIFYFIKWLLTL